MTDKVATEAEAETETEAEFTPEYGIVGQIVLIRRQMQFNVDFHSIHIPGLPDEYKLGNRGKFFTPQMVTPFRVEERFVVESKQLQREVHSDTCRCNKEKCEVRDFNANHPLPSQFKTVALRLVPCRAAEGKNAFGALQDDSFESVLKRLEDTYPEWKRDFKLYPNVRAQALTDCNKGFKHVMSSRFDRPVYIVFGPRDQRWRVCTNVSNEYTLQRPCEIDMFMPKLAHETDHATTYNKRYPPTWLEADVWNKLPTYLLPYIPRPLCNIVWGYASFEPINMVEMCARYERIGLCKFLLFDPVSLADSEGLNLAFFL